MPSVQLTRHLYSFFPHLEDQEIVVDASTVAEVVQRLEELAPGIAFYICDERGRLRQHVNIFVGQDRVQDPTKLSDPVGDDTTVHVIQALTGG